MKKPLFLTYFLFILSAANSQICYQSEYVGQGSSHTSDEPYDYSSPAFNDCVINAAGNFVFSGTLDSFNFLEFSPEGKYLRTINTGKIEKLVALEDGYLIINDSWHQEGGCMDSYLRSYLYIQKIDLNGEVVSSCGYYLGGSAERVSGVSYLPETNELWFSAPYALIKINIENGEVVKYLPYRVLHFQVMPDNNLLLLIQEYDSETYIRTTYWVKKDENGNTIAKKSIELPKPSTIDFGDLLTISSSYKRSFYALSVPQRESILTTIIVNAGPGKLKRLALIDGSGEIAWSLPIAAVRNAILVGDELWILTDKLTVYDLDGKFLREIQTGETDLDGYIQSMIPNTNGHIAIGGNKELYSEASNGKPFFKILGCHPISNVPDIDKFIITPNPSSDIAMMRLPLDATDISLNIYNSLGQSIFDQQIYNNFPVDVSAYPMGVYLFKVSFKLDGKVISDMLQFVR